MRFIMTAQPGKDTEPIDPNGPMDEKLFSDYMRFNEELHKAGVLVAAEGLNPAGKGARVEVKKGKRAVVDGPFTESKEMIAGYWLWQVKTIEEAVEWVRRCPHPSPGVDTHIEIRPLFEESDFC